jgi:hypothetical protein
MEVGKGFLSTLTGYYEKFLLPKKLLNEINVINNLSILQKKLKGTIYEFGDEEYWQIEERITKKTLSMIKEFIELAPKELSEFLKIIYIEKINFLSSVTGKKKIEYQKFLAKASFKMKKICKSLSSPEKEAFFSFFFYKFMNEKFEKKGDNDLIEFFEFLYNLEKQSKIVLKKMREFFWSKLDVKSRELKTLFELFTVRIGYEEGFEIAFIDEKNMEEFEEKYSAVFLPLCKPSSKLSEFWEVKKMREGLI